jgi:hypothetical protein
METIDSGIYMGRDIEIATYQLSLLATVFLHGGGTMLFTETVEDLLLLIHALMNGG